MNNIFENAYFGKSYKTRDGRKAIYLGDNSCWIEGGKTEIGYSRDGRFVDFQEHGIDIVSEWQESIDEKELDKLADEYAEGRWNSYAMIERRAFKDGYRKALEQ